MSVTTQTKAKQPGLLRSTAVVSSMTMLSRVLGFVRDMLFAHYFGATAAVDAFYVAFKIPNFMRRLFAEGAFSQAFVPVLSEYQSNKSHAEVREFISHILGTLAGILFVFTLVIMCLTPFIITAFAPGFLDDGYRFTLASDLLRITFPYLFFISLTAMSGAILNTYGSFGIPAFTPVLLNLAIILSILFGSAYFEIPVTACAWGVFFGGVIQLAFQVPFLWRKNLLPWPRFAWHNSGVRRVLTLMVPALFGVSVAQINLLLDTLFASFLAVGSVSWLYYSDRLMNFPLGVFGVAIAPVIMPSLSRKFATKSASLYSQTLDWAIRLVLVIAIPSAIGIAYLAAPLLITLFQYGAFTVLDVTMAQKSLQAFALGVPAFMLIKVLASGFYARQDIKTPVKIGVASMLVNTLLIIVFIKPLAHAGLALATSCSAIFNAAMLFGLLRKANIFVLSPGWWIFTGQIMGASLAMFTWLYGYSDKLAVWFSWEWHERLMTLAILVVVAIVIYVATLLILGYRPRRGVA